MLNAQKDVITDVRMSIEIMTYVLQMSKLQKESAKADSSTFDTHSSLFGIVGRDGSLEILLDCARMLAGEQLR